MSEPGVLTFEQQEELNKVKVSICVIFLLTSAHIRDSPVFHRSISDEKMLFISESTQS